MEGGREGGREERRMRRAEGRRLGEGWGGRKRREEGEEG